MRDSLRHGGPKLAKKKWTLQLTGHVSFPRNSGFDLSHSGKLAALGEFERRSSAVV